MKGFGVAALVSLMLVDPAQSADGALARCGASKGHGYYFYDKVGNPKGPAWTEDGIKEGKIVLIRLGGEWDIQFGDAVGAYGYRQDGAKVIPLGSAKGKLTIGAFRGSYTDVFTFDFAQKEVVWSSHKVDVLVPKAAIYHASCSFVSPEMVAGE